ncbi:hypothetical protein M408DRAFT_326966 [Serendipita vermifera MAFF 305830]|uniref:Uncharacterized protein n=1 Tax=Serendipita vermifera MAFF 305830 TaxID=933852 RepID=A0A0C3B6C0_SERVB|nr:hypothetical protein M408DRAFT_326966 [Serendipita vermifera MAFF 305830]
MRTPIAGRSLEFTNPSNPKANRRATSVKYQVVREFFPLCRRRLYTSSRIIGG